MSDTEFESSTAHPTSYETLPRSTTKDLSDVGRARETSSPFSSRKIFKNLKRIPYPIQFLIILLSALLISISLLKKKWDQEALATNTDVNTELLSINPMAARMEPIDGIIRSANGQTLSLSAFRGKVVLMTFWASWCEPCLAEIGGIRKLFETIGSKDLVVLPINLDEEKFPSTRALDLWNGLTLPFATYFDTEGRKLSTDLGVESFPTVIVLDRQGRLAMAGAGSNEWSSSQSLDAIQSLLKE